ncbi:MAG: response regulator [Deltaproteobacteria bacterium]|nr:response regulator [Deltaproteobacteria bacterium]
MKKKKILIVDDDPSIRLLLQARLMNNGYDVIMATNGEECIRHCTNQQPDLIILDVKMPKMDGWTCLHELRQTQQGKSVPILMATAQSNLQDSFEAEGIAGFVTKPYNPTLLIEQIAKILA